MKCKKYQIRLSDSPKELWQDAPFCEHPAALLPFCPTMNDPHGIPFRYRGLKKTFGNFHRAQKMTDSGNFLSHRQTLFMRTNIPK